MPSLNLKLAISRPQFYDSTSLCSLSISKAGLPDSPFLLFSSLFFFFITTGLVPELAEEHAIQTHLFNLRPKPLEKQMSGIINGKDRAAFFIYSPVLDHIQAFSLCSIAWHPNLEEKPSTGIKGRVFPSLNVTGWGYRFPFSLCCGTFLK